MTEVRNRQVAQGATKLTLSAEVGTLGPAVVEVGFWSPMPGKDRLMYKRIDGSLCTRTGC